MTAAVITVTVPERAAMLGELAGDLAAQTAPGFVWLVGWERRGVGPAQVRNELVASSAASWVAFVDDDDRVDPDHMATLLEVRDAHRDADVIYTACRIEGRDGFVIPHDCDHVGLDRENLVPVTALVRRRMFERAGGFDVDERNEDHGLWRRILALGGRFQCDHRVTWTYRFHGTNRSLG